MSERVDLKALREVAEKACDDPRVRLDNQDYAEVTQSGGFQAMVATDADAQFMLLFDKKVALALLTAVEAALEVERMRTALNRRVLENRPQSEDKVLFEHLGRAVEAHTAALAPFRESGR